MKILVATDGSKAGDSAIRFAARLASSCRRGRLLAITVGECPARRSPGGARLRYGLPAAMGEQDRLRAGKILDRALRDGKRLGASVRCAYVGTSRFEPIAWTIAKAADRDRADLVVVGSGGGTQLSRWALGSIANRLVHVARRPVAVVRVGARMKRRPVRILVATDGSKPSAQAVRFGTRLAAAMPQARLVVLTVSTLASDLALTGAWLVRAVAPLPELVRAERKAAERILRAAARETRRLGKRVRHLYRKPLRAVPAAEAIVREASVQSADLILLGNTGRTAVDNLLLGSVAQRVLGLSRRPVALVRARSKGRP